MILHSGNHELVGIRHRRTQTLYISHLIQPHSCADPAYGKLQVGIYIAAIRDTMDRAMQDVEAKEKISRDSSADISQRSEEANSDGDLDDYSPERPTRSGSDSNRQNRGSGGKGKRQGGDKGNAKRHLGEKDVNGQSEVCTFSLRQASGCS